jgi:hypothetical protein
MNKLTYNIACNVAKIFVIIEGKKLKKIEVRGTIIYVM